MDDPLEEMGEVPFFVHVNLGLERDSELFIIPDWDFEQDKSLYIVVLDEVELGILCVDGEIDFGFMQEVLTWYWEDGNLSQEVAQAIGRKIEFHYL